MKKFFVLAILCLVPISFVGAEQPAEVIEVEETSPAGGNTVTTTETVTVTTTTGTGMVTTKPKKCDLSKRWYFGGGLNYAFENFKDELSEVDWDNTWGLDIKAGYFFTDYFALEFMFQYLNEFEYKESGYYWGYYDYKATLTGYNFTLNGKAFIPLDGIFRPYGVLGLGYANGELKEKLSDAWGTYTYTDKNSGLFGRIGAGADVFLSEQFALEGEVSYNIGFGDIDNIRYTSLALNALVLF